MTVLELTPVHNSGTASWSVRSKTEVSEIRGHREGFIWKSETKTEIGDHETCDVLMETARWLHG